MKRLFTIFLLAAMVFNSIATTTTFAKENFKIYLNEGYEDSPTNASPLKAIISGEGNIVRAEKGGNGKYVVVRNKAAESVAHTVAVNSKYIYVETRVKINDYKSPKTAIQVKMGGKLQDLVTFRDGGKIVDFMGNVCGRYLTNQWYEVGVLINTQTRMYNIFLDDRTIYRCMANTSAKGGIESVGYASGESANSETSFCVDYVRVYTADKKLKNSDFPSIKYNQTSKEILIDEVADISNKPKILFNHNFDGLSGLPSGLGSQSGRTTVENEDGNGYVQIAKTNEGGAYNDLNLNTTVSKLVFEADVKSTQIGSDIYFGMLRDTSAVFSTSIKFTNDGMITLYNGRVLGKESIMDNWVNIGLILDFNTKTYDVYINRELAVSNVTFEKTNISSDLVLIRFDLRSGDLSNLQYDNLKCYTSDRLIDDLEAEAGIGEDVSEETFSVKTNSFSAGNGIIENPPKLEPDKSKIKLFEETPSNNPSSYFTDYAVALATFKNTVCFVLDNERAWVKDGRYHISGAPMLYEGKTIIPAKVISETFGLGIEWNAETNTVTLGGNITAKDKESKFIIDGKEVPTDVPVQVIDGTMYLPLKELANDVLGKYYFQSFKGIDVVSDNNMTLNDDTTIAPIKDILSYIVFDRPNTDLIFETFEENNPNDDHPRLLGKQEDLAKMLANAKTDENMKKWSEKIMQEAVYLRSLPNTGSSSAGAIFTLYWAYRNTGDISYAKKAEEIGLRLASFPNWALNEQFLEVSGKAWTSALVIDLFYDELGQENRDTIANAILDYALRPASNHYYGKGASNWPVRENNWNIVCNSGVVAAAMTLIGEYDPNLCADVIEKALKSSEYMMHTYAPEGAWMEGPSYWDYTVQYNVIMAYAMEKVFSTDFGLMKTPGVMQTGYFPTFVSGNTGAFAYHDAPITYLVNSPELLWFASKNKDAGLMKLRLDAMSKYNFKPAFEDLIYYDPDLIAEEITLPLDKYYGFAEVATTRSDWGPVATFAAIHAGANTVPHGQIDMGNFEYEVFGTRFATDTGKDNYNLPGYFGAERNQYYVNRAEGHNVYVINPDAGPGQSPAANSVIETVEVKPKGSIYKIDLTSAYKDSVKKAERGFMLTQNRKIFVVQDEITPNPGDEYYWFWHTPGEIKINDDKKSVLLTSGGKNVTLYFDSTVPFTIESGKALPLETSPNNPAQMNGLTLPINKVTVRFTAGSDDIIFRATAVPQGIEYSNSDLSRISDWSIPDGETSQHFAYLDNIYLDGEKMQDFDQIKLDYEVTLDNAVAPLPEITTDSEGTVTIYPPTKENPKAVIKVQSKEEPQNIIFYTLEFKTLTKIGTPTGSIHSPVDITASNHDGNVPENVNDGILSTRWSAEGIQWIQYDLGDIKDINAVAFAFYQGKARRAYFSIQVSDDGEYFETLATGVGTGTNDDYEYIEFPTKKARYVRINGFGNSANGWNSVAELKVYGD